MKRRLLAASCAALGLVAAGCGLKEKFPERAVFVANGNAASVSVIDPADGRVVGEIALDAGFHPYHLALSPDGTRLVIAAPSADLSLGHGDGGGSSKVYVVDTTTGDQNALLDVDATVQNSVFLDDFSSVVLAQKEKGSLAGYDAGTLDAQWTAEVGGDPLEVTLLTGGRLAVANSGDGTLTIVDAATHTATDTAAVGAGPTALWATPAGLFVALEGDKSVAILSSGNLTDVTGAYDVGGVPGQVASAKNGGDVWIAVEDRGVIEVRDPASGKVTQTIAVGGKPHGLVIDASAGLVYVTDQKGGRVVRVDATTYAVKDEIAVGATPSGIAQNGF